MQKNELTAQKLRDRMTYSPDTGEFRWRYSPRYGIQAGDVAGTKNRRGYVIITISRHNYSAHRLAWLYVTGSWPSKAIDHVNGVRDDNRFGNLRDVSNSINQQNLKGARGNNKTGLLGVSLIRSSGLYVAVIQKDRKQKVIGRFSSPQAAHSAYMREKLAWHDGYQP